jgi:hypothetical protein
MKANTPDPLHDFPLPPGVTEAGILSPRWCRPWYG